MQKYELRSAVYAEQGPALITNAPQDIAISDPLSGLSDNTDLLVITSCIVQIGAGITQLNAAIGIHHPNSSGGGTPSNLGITVLAGEAYKQVHRLWKGNPASLADIGANGDWGDATVRLGVTGVGATANSPTLAVGIAVWVATQV